ncbi:MAG: hypothetical protein M3252_04460 [Actinomycetota bacterium]|nr:hypothetical protein [Actinomycetota bacterium]
MKDPFNRYVETATHVTREAAERIVRSFRKQGESATENAQGIVDSLRERSQENREAIAGLVRLETKRVISAMGLATRDDVERLEQQIAELRASMAAGPVTATDGLEAEAPRGTREAARRTAARRTVKKADSADSPAVATTAAERAGQVGTIQEATVTAADLTVPAGEAPSPGESPPMPQPPVEGADSGLREGDG